MNSALTEKERLEQAKKRLEATLAISPVCNPPSIKLVDQEQPPRIQSTLFRYYNVCNKGSTTSGLSQSQCITQDSIDDYEDTTDSVTNVMMKTGNLIELAKRVPAQINGEIKLLSYQISGVGWLISLMKQKSGGILAMDMGMGKTVQVVAAMKLILEERTEDPSHAEPMTCIILCLPAMLGTWNDHLKRICPKLRIFQYHGPRKQTILNEIDSLPPGDSSYAILTTYDTLRRDFQVLAKTPISGEPWFCFIADEAQAFKNPDTAIFKAVCQLEAHSRIFLTATPILNHYEELWSLMHLIEPKLLGDIRSFRVAYGDIIKAKAINSSRQRYQSNKLRHLVTPYILRRMKTQESMLDMLSRPPRSDRATNPATPGAIDRNKYKALLDVVMFFELSSAQTEAYTRCLRMLDHSQNIMVNITKLLSLCMAVDTPDDEEVCPKYKFLENVLPRWIKLGHSVLIFSKWRKTLDNLERCSLSKLKIPWARVDGTQSAQEKQRNIDRFQSSREPMLMLVTTKAGGTGLTLTKANRVIILDPSWCGADDIQAIGRAHRIGQKSDVISYRMLYAGTIEEHMFLYQVRKLAASTEILRDADMKTELTYSDVKHFFRYIPALQSAVKQALDLHMTGEARANLAKLLKDDLSPPAPRPVKPVDLSGSYSAVTSEDGDDQPVGFKRTSVLPDDQDAAVEVDEGPKTLGYLSVYPMEAIIAKRADLHTIEG